MFPLPISTWVMVGLTVFALAGFGYGKYEHNKYVTYKAEVENIAKAQEAHVKSIQKQHQLVTKGISDEYDAKLALIRQYYANGVRSPSTSSVSNLSDTTKLFDASTAYNQLASNCAQTTLMLTELQRWINDQMGIK
jgi:hypothetical protein